MRFIYRTNQETFMQQVLNDYYLGPTSWRGRLHKIVIIFALCGWSGFNLNKLNFMHLGISLGLLVLFFVWLAWRKKLLVKMLERKFQSVNQPSQELEYLLSEESLSLNLDEKTVARPWPEFTQAINCSEGFLLYPGPIWLPKNALVEANELEAAAFLQRKINDYSDKSKLR